MEAYKKHILSYPAHPTKLAASLLHLICPKFVPDVSKGHNVEDLSAFQYHHISNISIPDTDVILDMLLCTIVDVSVGFANPGGNKRLRYFRELTGLLFRNKLDL